MLYTLQTTHGRHLANIRASDWREARDAAMQLHNKLYMEGRLVLTTLDGYHSALHPGQPKGTSEREENITKRRNRIEGRKAARRGRKRTNQWMDRCKAAHSR